MGFIDSIDPFLLQLVIIPLIVIGIGVVTALFIRKLIIAPIVTLILNASYEFWYFRHYYPESKVIFSSWNIIFPVISLIIAWVFFKKKNK
ncbi:hypothetical protein [Ectobacillus panaciterrae]|uniref:hypothetical protein n=1 Tax=Ectobacillus panaciterrae TaxID=363872 RepID=UPI00048BE6A4|nr:hypothetical protein [Ectobacillus panaciterrae]